MLNLMYITNNPCVARAAQDAGVDWIFIDMEWIGKDRRQGGMDTVQSHHTINDIRSLRPVINQSKILVRCNPIHEASYDYNSIEEEIEQIIDAGADIIMLPFFQTKEQVVRFINDVNGRAKTMLLIETPEAVDNLDDILQLKGIDFCHIGINDLHLGYHRKFMFELLADGTVEYICEKIRHAGIPFGFGGIARPGSGTLPAEMILGEHIRIGSSMVILSRSFYDQRVTRSDDEMRTVFRESVADVRFWERKWKLQTSTSLNQNHSEIVEIVRRIAEDV